jgi:hypothetical protein
MPAVAMMLPHTIIKMKYRIKNTVDTARRLYRDSVPAPVIDQILGREFEHTGTPIKVHATFLGQDTSWEIAPDCIEQIPETLNPVS